MFGNLGEIGFLHHSRLDTVKCQGILSRMNIYAYLYIYIERDFEILREIERERERKGVLFLFLFLFFSKLPDMPQRRRRKTILSLPNVATHGGDDT